MTTTAELIAHAKDLFLQGKGGNAFQLLHNALGAAEIDEDDATALRVLKAMRSFAAMAGNTKFSGGSNGSELEYDLEAINTMIREKELRLQTTVGIQQQSTTFNATGLTDA